MSRASFLTLMRSQTAILVLPVLAAILTAGALLIYLEAYGYVGGGGRAVCSPSRVGGYLLEAYISPATPRVSETFQISAVISEEDGSAARANLTLIIVGSGRVVTVEGPKTAYNGIATWSLSLNEDGSYSLTLLVSGDRGSGSVPGGFRVFAERDAAAHSVARIASITTLLVGIPLLLGIVVLRLFGGRGATHS
ncbi:MAG: hypothetical protein RQ862_09880 [Candidatus Caldarchaeales archaeon]|nr:hypothetical protein [Candidatus Caldarchaeales archaeon]